MPTGKGEGVLAPVCGGGQNAYGGRWDTAPYRKLGSTVPQQETVVSNSEDTVMQACVLQLCSAEQGLCWNGQFWSSEKGCSGHGVEGEPESRFMSAGQETVGVL